MNKGLSHYSNSGLGWVLTNCMTSLIELWDSSGLRSDMYPVPESLMWWW